MEKMKFKPRSYKEWLADTVLELRELYPNDQEFGEAVAKAMKMYKNYVSLFPGVQNL